MSGAKTSSFSHQISCYQVETRARVIIFDIAAFEADSTLQRRSSSLVPLTVDHPHRPLSREHGLMSWPENIYKAKSHEQNLENGRAKSLSAKAMQLSIFGSMVDVQCSSRNVVRRSHSMSFSRAASFHGRSLVSVRSEGNATVRKNLQVRNLTWKVPAPRHSTVTNESHALDHSSDESGAEDEHIVRIDSPSRLSFRQAS